MPGKFVRAEKAYSNSFNRFSNRNEITHTAFPYTDKKREKYLENKHILDTRRNWHKKKIIILTKQKNVVDLPSGPAVSVASLCWNALNGKLVCNQGDGSKYFCKKKKCKNLLNLTYMCTNMCMDDLRYLLQHPPVPPER